MDYGDIRDIFIVVKRGLFYYWSYVLLLDFCCEREWEKSRIDFVFKYEI